MRRSRLSGLLAAFAATACACIAAGGCSSLAGLSGGALPDAASVATDSGPGVDGPPDPLYPNDAGARDAGDASDTDAATDADTPPARFCADATTGLCDDFDDPGALGARWSKLNFSKGSLALDDAAVRSPPHSLLVATETSTVGVNASLERTSAAQVSEVHVAFDVRLESRSPSDSFDILKLSFTSDVPSYLFDAFLIIGPSGTQLAQYWPDPDGGAQRASLKALLAHPLVTGTWTRVDVRLVLGTGLGSSPTIRVTYDGVSVPEYQSPPAWGEQPRAVLTGVSVGLLESGAAVSPASVRFDDVIVETR